MLLAVTRARSIAAFIAPDMTGTLVLFVIALLNIFIKTSKLKCRR